MKRFSIAVLLVVISGLWAQDPKQKLNIPDARGWDKDPRFTVTDRVWPAAHGEADVCMYENDALAAICFSVDDDYVQDHEWWLTTMEHYGWTMTWFLIVAYIEDGSSGFHGNWDTYRRLDSLGHDIASHTWSHGHCNDPENSYSTLGCPEILTGGNCCDADFEYAEAQRLIRENIPGNQCWTQAYSGHTVEDRTATVAGTTFTYDSYAHDFSIAAQYYIGARGTTGNPNMPHRANYMNTSIGAYDQAGIDRVLNPATLHYYRGFICKFWHSKGDTAAVIQNFDYIKAQETAGNMWVPSYQNLLKYTQSWVTRELTVLDVADSMVAFTLSDSMRDTIYNYPLTVKVRVNNDWDTVLAYQAGQSVEARLVSHEGNRYALVKAVPDGGEVQITKGSGTVVTKVKDPFISPDGGTHTGRVSVSISTATPGASIYYTTDGSDPSDASTEYSGAFDLTAPSTTLKAIGIMSGKDDSEIITAVFTVVADITAPLLVSASGADNTTRITLLFNEAVNRSEAENAGNYTVPGLTVQGASLAADDMTVSLTVTEMTADTEYTVTVASISDMAVSPNTATGLQASFTYTESQAFEGQTAYWSMNTLNGDTVPDEIGSNHGTAYNLDWTANGYDGGALYFNGYDTLDVGTGDFGVDATGDVSVSMWFKADALGGYLVEKGPYVRPYHLQIHSGRLRGIVRTGGTNYITGTTSLATGTWYHAVLTVDSTDAVLYLNNAVEQTYGLSGVMDSGTGQYTFIGTGFDGIIDEVRIWNRALNAVEVDALYNYGGTTAILRSGHRAAVRLPDMGPVYYDCRGERVFFPENRSGVFFRVDGDKVTRIISIR